MESGKTAVNTRFATMLANVQVLIDSTFISNSPGRTFIVQHL